MSNDPTTASIGARNDEFAQLRAENQRLSRELAQLRAENQHLSRELVDARTEVEVTRRDRDRLSAALRVEGHDLCELSGSPDGEWSGLVVRLNALRKRLDEKPRKLRMSYSLQPGSILNAYREGDLSFDEACGILGSAEFSITPRRAQVVTAFAEAEAAWAIISSDEDNPLVRRYPVPGGWLYQVSVARGAMYKARGCDREYDWDNVAWHAPQVVAFHLGETR